MNPQKKNDRIKELLDKREIYFQSIEEEEIKRLDDINLRKYNLFKERYNSLTQLEKDVWFLSTQLKKVEIADLYDVSPSYITQLLIRINKKIKL